MTDPIPFYEAPQVFDPEIPVDSISEWGEENPNEGDDEVLRESLDEYGFFGVVLIQKSSRRIVVGNTRYRNSVAKGAKTLPGFLVDWDDEQAKGVLLMDNASARRAIMNQAKLLALLKERADLPGGLRGTGYSMDAYTDMLKAWEPGGGEGDTLSSGQGPTLADRFLVPPFDVLDARQGWWQARKRAWLALGIASELGRTAEAIVGQQKLNKRIAEYAQKDPNRTGPQYRGGIHTGTSVFDPVLCELAYRWFSPPAGQVIDPFAGGSVRGIVAGMLGRHYAGCDLSGEQVTANREQADDFRVRGLLAAAPTKIGPEDLTPVEEHPLGDGTVWVKRDDAYVLGGSAGGKVRSCLSITMRAAAKAGADPAGLVTAGSRHSPQVNIVAAIARYLGAKCRVHVPAAAGSTPELLAAAAAGAEVVEHRPGHNSVIKARARDDAEARGWLLIPFGMEHPSAVTETAAQVASIAAMPEPPKRIVVPVGSGMTLAGVLRGLADTGLDIPVLGVCVGADPRTRIDKFAPPGWRGRCNLIDAAVKYEAEVHDESLGFPLDPIYEAKCVPYLQPGDLFWVVGCRETARPPTAVPQWAEAEATEWTRDLEPECADFMFTCPPYYDLEKYSDAEGDLSAMGTTEFNHAYTRILVQAARALRPDRFAVIVTGDARDGHGGLRDLRGVTIAAMAEAGLSCVSGAVLVTAVGSLPVRAAKHFTAARILGRTHQDVLVFVKGDRKKATEACGPVETYLPEGMAEAEEEAPEGEEPVAADGADA